MNSFRWWLICYDVRDARRLKKCARHMEGYGERIQFSVFRCWLNRSNLERVRWELTEILAPEDDVIFVPLCRSCSEGIVVKSGAETTWPPCPPGFYVV